MAPLWYTLSEDEQQWLDDQEGSAGRRQFRRRTQEFAAVQFFRDMPQWPEEVVLLGKGEGEVFERSHPNAAEAFAVCPGHGPGRLIVENGDWIVFGNRGPRDVIDNETLMALFEEVHGIERREP